MFIYKIRTQLIHKQFRQGLWVDSARDKFCNLRLFLDVEVKKYLNHTLGTLISFILASSRVFCPFLELHFEQAVTCYQMNITNTCLNYCWTDQIDEHHQYVPKSLCNRSNISSYQILPFPFSTLCNWKNMVNSQIVTRRTIPEHRNRLYISMQNLILGSPRLVIAVFFFLGSSSTLNHISASR